MSEDPSLFQWAVVIIFWVVAAPFFVVSHWIWFFEIYPVEYWEQLPGTEHVLSAMGFHIALPFSLGLYWGLVKAVLGTLRSSRNEQRGNHDQTPS